MAADVLVMQVTIVLCQFARNIIMYMCTVYRTPREFCTLFMCFMVCNRSNISFRHYIYIHIYTYIIGLCIYTKRAVSFMHAYIIIVFLYLHYSRICSNNRKTIEHDDVIKWKHFPRYCPFVRGIHWSPVNSPHKGQWRGALMFSLISAWINGLVNAREAGDLKCHRAHYYVTPIKQKNAFAMYWLTMNCSVEINRFLYIIAVVMPAIISVCSKAKQNWCIESTSPEAPFTNMDYF